MGHYLRCEVLLAAVARQMSTGPLHWPLRPDVREAMLLAPEVQGRVPGMVVMAWMDYGVGASQRR